MGNSSHRKVIWNMLVIFVGMMMLLSLIITLIDIGVDLASSISMADRVLESTLGAVINSQGL